MRMQLIAIIPLFLGGCAGVSPLTIFKPVEVKVPVAVPCISKKDIPVEPVYELDSANILGNIDDKGVLALKEIEQRRLWQSQAKAVLIKCAE